jgi:hypothetical protein
MLYELFVPVDCDMREVGGEPFSLVRFDDGQDPAPVLLERFADRVANPFCYEAARHPDGVPRLAFVLGETGRAREYRCEPKGWGVEIPLPRREGR